MDKCFPHKHAVLTVSCSMYPLPNVLEESSLFNRARIPFSPGRCEMDGTWLLSYCFPTYLAADRELVRSPKPLLRQECSDPANATLFCIKLVFMATRCVLETLSHCRSLAVMLYAGTV